MTIEYLSQTQRVKKGEGLAVIGEMVVEMLGGRTEDDFRRETVALMEEMQFQIWMRKRLENESVEPETPLFPE